MHGRITLTQRVQRHKLGPPTSEALFLELLRLCCLNPSFTTMLGTLSGFREVRIGILQHGILVAMTNLLLKANVSGLMMIFCFRRPFTHILVGVSACHACLAIKWGNAQLNGRPLKVSLFHKNLE